MSEGEVELDEIEVVEVTGKSHRDRHRNHRKKKCNCSPSLRATSILIFICVGVVYVAGVAVGNVLMFNSLETLDMRASNNSINRFAMLIQDDMHKLLQFVVTYCDTNPALTGIQNLVQHPEMDPEEAVKNFVVTFLNTTGVFDDDGNQIGLKYTVAMEVTYWAFLDVDFNTKYAIYYPKDPKETTLVSSVRQYPAPVISPDIYKSVMAEIADDAHFLKLLIPDEGDDKPMIISMEPIMDLSDPGSGPKGYLVGGNALFPRMKQFSDDAPSCVVVQDGPSGDSDWDDVDRDMFDQVVPGTFGANKTYGGAAAFLKRGNDIISKTAGRMCPDVPLFNDTETLMVGYFKLCGLDPEKYKEKASCILMRADRPMSMVDQGTLPVITLSTAIIVMMVFLCVLFVIFLDCVVLRRIVNLSNVIRTQTKGHADALKDEDETTTTTTSVRENEPMSGVSGKSGKSSSKSSRSASGTSDTSQTTASSEGDVGRHQHKSARDEIENLKRDMEQNAIGLRKRLEAVNDSIKLHQQKIIRDKQAMQLVNLWRGRKDYFPGLRANAMQLRYEPPRNLDDLLSNPLAIEYLKSHCESDRTLENLWFILDVSWLQELETAEDNEDDEEKRSQIHDVAAYAAKTIMKRYIDVNAPQQINVSAGTFKKLREKGDHYARQMFDDAVGEVKLMLNTDILPRFQKSGSYSAMSETLYVGTAGGGEDSEFSDETVSTTNSILTDEGEEGDGVSRVFAHTFKNLQNAFDPGQHNSSTFSDSSSSHGAPVTTIPPHISPLVGNLTTTTTPSEEDEPEKEEPKKEESKVEEESKKDESKKESGGESEKSNGSSDSSSSGSTSKSATGSDDSE